MIRTNYQAIIKPRLYNGMISLSRKLGNSRIGVGTNYSVTSGISSSIKILVYCLLIILHKTRKSDFHPDYFQVITDIIFKFKLMFHDSYKVARTFIFVSPIDKLQILPLWHLKEYFGYY